MHAFLITGKNPNLIENKIHSLTKKLAITPLEYQLKNIDQARKLNVFARMKVARPTGIVLKNVDSATQECLNAILKNLEEPQENLYYILTASSEHKVLPTILSRCQTLKAKDTDPGNGTAKDARETILKSLPNTETVSVKPKEDPAAIKNFINSKIGSKFNYLTKYKKRDEAEFFLQDIISFLHKDIVSSEKINPGYVNCLKITQKTLNSIKRNGNVTLQLTNFAIALSMSEKQ